jgi:hypothetical protein
LDGNDVELAKEGTCRDRKGKEYILSGRYLEKLDGEVSSVAFVNMANSG